MMLRPADELLDYDEVMQRYDVVLGLEVHVELNTRSKMWCGCATDFGGAPNTRTCPVCLGLPGSLPVVNRKAVESAIKIGLSLNCQIATWCRFARKNYFYPDMPKNYQVSQHDEPLCYDGSVDVEVDGNIYTIPIERVHMEEDAGKTTHMGTSGRIQAADYALMDYNRAGVPLMEIVTKPIFATQDKAPQVASAYLRYLRDMVQALKVSDGRMERGQLRCDANVSLMKKGSTTLGIRTETKNVNSLKSVEAALRYEICRQAAILEAGGKVKQETRMWNEAGYTNPGRSKETAEDYRYFPEPDLVPVAPSREWVEQLRASLPEAPAIRRARLQEEWQFSDLEMRDINGTQGALDLIVATVEAGATPASARKWWLGELARRANEAKVSLEELPITAVQVATIQSFVDQSRLTDKLARQVIDGVLNGEGEPDEVIVARGLEIIADDSALQNAVDEAISAHPDIADKIRAGKVQAAGALIGMVMKSMRGQADAAKVRQMIMDKLS